MCFCSTAARAGTPSPAPPDISGSWALEIASVSAARIVIVGRLKSTSRTWILLTTSRQGDTWMQDHRVCAAEVRGGLVRTRVPAAFVAAVAPKRYAITLSADAQGTRYDADTLDYSMGYDPSCSALPPQEADDPCVRDPDADGHPGATILARVPAFPWVEVYVAQLARPVLAGHLVGVDRIEGGVSMAVMKTVVLGASNRLFASSPQVIPLPEQSHFQADRLPAGATCAEVLAHFDVLPPS